MPLLHFIGLDCTPRRELPGGALERCARDRATLANLETELGSPPPDGLKLTRKLRRPDGTEEAQEFTPATLRAAAEQLAPLAAECSGCPAALVAAPFTCIQSISFPLSAAAEQWLVDRIGAADTLAGQFFRASARAMGYGRDCPLLAEWRRGGLLASPVSLLRSGEPENDPVTGDQVLHALLLSGDLDPVRCLTALLFTGALTTEDGAGPDEMIALISRLQTGQGEGPPPELLFALPEGSGEDASTLELRGFLFAAFTAFRLGMPLRLLIVP